MRKLLTILLFIPFLAQAQISVVGSYIPPVSDTTLKYRLLAYWKMNETSGTTLADSKGLTPITLTGSLTNATGILGKGVSQANVDDIGQTDSYTYFNLSGKSAFSVSIWFKMTTLSSVLGRDQVLLLQFGTSWLIGAYLDITEFTDKLRFNVTNNLYTTFSASTANSSISTGAWHHVVVTVAAGQNINIYLDGVLSNASTEVFTGTVIAPVTKLFIGNNGNPDNALIGTIDELGIWNMALPIQRVWRLYNSGTGLSYPF